MFADRGINVAAQYLQTTPEIGYVVMEIHSDKPEDVLHELKAIDGTLKARVLL